MVTFQTFASADVEPPNFVPKSDEVINMDLKVVLRLDEGVGSIRKVFDGDSSPVSMICADVNYVCGRKSELFEQREKGVKPVSGSVVQADQAKSKPS